MKKSDIVEILMPAHFPKGCLAYTRWFNAYMRMRKAQLVALLDERTDPNVGEFTALYPGKR